MAVKKTSFPPLLAHPKDFPFFVDIVYVDVVLVFEFSSICILYTCHHGFYVDVDSEASVSVILIYLVGYNWLIVGSRGKCEDI